MDKTVIVQNPSQIMIEPDVYEYKIETSVTEAGELPTLQIFVYTISDDDDPSLDKFARVATPGDLDGPTKLFEVREDAVTAGVTEYLSSYFSVQYPDLTVAAQARTAITSRINDLINNWIIYRDEFMADAGDDQYFPTTDPALEQQLIDAYKTTKDDRIAAEQALLEATTDLTLAEKDAENAQTVYEIYKKEQEFGQQMYTVDWAKLDGALSILFSAEDVFLSNSKSEFCSLASLSLGTSITWPLADPPATLTLLATTGLIPSTDWSDWYYALINFESAKTGFSTTGSPARAAIGTACMNFFAQVAANVAYSYNTKQGMDSLVQDAVMTKKEAEATLAAAQKAEDAALAKLKEFCPTFDPASV